MARVRLQKTECLPGVPEESTSYDVAPDEYFWKAKPFKGPPGVDWAAFKVTKGGAEFQWRVPAEYFEEDEEMLGGPEENEVLL